MWRATDTTMRPTATAALLVLVGGLMFRVVIVLSSNATSVI
jgi:hypothetical protein